MEVARPKTKIPNPGHRGYVVKAPGALNAEFTVWLESFGRQHVFQIRNWMPRGALIPAHGDEVLVLFDDNDEPWVPAWRPGTV